MLDFSREHGMRVKRCEFKFEFESEVCRQLQVLIWFVAYCGLSVVQVVDLTMLRGSLDGLGPGVCGFNTSQSADVVGFYAHRRFYAHWRCNRRKRCLCCERHPCGVGLWSRRTILQQCVRMLWPWSDASLGDQRICMFVCVKVIVQSRVRGNKKQGFVLVICRYPACGSSIPKERRVLFGVVVDL